MIRARMYAASMLLPAAAGLLCGLQGQTSAPPSFEVASVKRDTQHQWVRRPWSPNVDCGPIAKCGVIGNRFVEMFASLDDLIMDAYGVQRFQIGNPPSWADTGTDVYDVEATIPADSPHTLDAARLMLQSLLADRFQLKIHREPKELPVYSLRIGKSGAKLKPSETPCTLPPRPGSAAAAGSRGAVSAAGGPPRALMLMDYWALTPERLGGRVDRPIVDKTGFTAQVYCTLDGYDAFAVLLRELGPGSGRRGGVGPRGENADAATGPSIFTAIEDAWGLRLEKDKGQVDVLVIDHVERPSEN